jgi:polyisoprenoid-binding protein YceI
MSGIRGGRFIALWVAGLFAGSVAEAQETKWSVEGLSSLAWWQINPHRQLMWGTTCPEDPAWQPGEGASQSSKGNPFGASSDTAYARHASRRVDTRCAPSVTGTVTRNDSTGWEGVQGSIVVRAGALMTGLDMRDRYARTVVLETARYPEIRFTIDSLVNVERGETTRALAVGTFELRGERVPMSVPITFSECAAGLRVRATFDIPVRSLVERFHVSRYALGLANQGVWKSIEVGVDVVLAPTPTAIAATQ